MERRNSTLSEESDGFDRGRRWKAMVLSVVVHSLGIALIIATPASVRVIRLPTQTPVWPPKRDTSKFFFVDAQPAGDRRPPASKIRRVSRNSVDTSAMQKPRGAVADASPIQAISVPPADSGQIHTGRLNSERRAGVPDGDPSSQVAFQALRVFDPLKSDVPAGPGGTLAPTGFAPSVPSKPATDVVDVPDEPAQLLKKPIPEYPEEARRRHVTGDVLLEVKITTSGRIVIIRVVSSPWPGLEEPAKAAVGKITARPAMRSGHPVEVFATVTVEFRLS